MALAVISREFWKKLFEAKDLQSRVLKRGVALTIIPVFAIICVVWIVNAIAGSAALDGYSRLANQDKDHIILALLGACKLYDQHISSALEGASVVLARAGSVHFDASKNLSWTAKNQITSETRQLQLPLMKLGDKSVQPVADFAHEAPLVDEVQSLYKTSATVFQRMNAAGDMLRVSTTIRKADGSRAIGTYIPAFGADGKINPVIGKVLKGETYLGRAFVVNNWYMAAYQPIRDAKGSVVGMIYTGLPEAQLRDRLVQFRDYWAESRQVDMFVLHTAAKAQGLFVYSGDPMLKDQVAWDYRDGQNTLYIQQLCNAAKKAGEGKISEISYWTLPDEGKASQKMLVRFVYFPAWDWVIGIQQPEKEFLATPAKMKYLFRLSDYLPLLLAVVAVFLSLAIWRRLTGELAEQVRQILTKLDRSSKEVGVAIQSIGKHSDSMELASEQLSRATHVQASAAEETSVATGSVTVTARQNSKAAEQMRTLSLESEVILEQTRNILKSVDSAMQDMLSNSNRALNIIEAINDISFATNIVAINASVEAANAGDAGRSFAYIAAEVRELAAKVAAAAQETRTVIHGTRKEMDKGSAYVQKLVSSLTPMHQNADRIRVLAVDVSGVSLSQAESMGEVLKAVEQIQKASSQSAGAAQQSSGYAVDLRTQVVALGASVREVDKAVATLEEQFFGL